MRTLYILKKRSFIFLIFITVIAFVSGYLIMKDDLSTGKDALNIVSDKNIDLQVRDVLYTDISESGLKWEITADNASYIKDNNLCVFDKISAKLHTKEGRIFLLKGDKGTLKADTKDIEINGNVTILSEKAERFITDSLKYSHNEQRLHTDSLITIETPRMRISGVGMTLSIKNKDLSLLSNVKANVTSN